MKCKFGDSTPLSKAASRIQVRHLITEAAKGVWGGDKEEEMSEVVCREEKPTVQGLLSKENKQLSREMIKAYKIIKPVEQWKRQ